jgi:hypothetical protein
VPHERRRSCRTWSAWCRRSAAPRPGRATLQCQARRVVLSSVYGPSGLGSGYRRRANRDRHLGCIGFRPPRHSKDTQRAR